MDNPLLSVVLLLICFLLTGFLLFQRKQIRLLHEQVAVDPLTGLLNRRAFMRACNRLIELLPLNGDHRHSSLSAMAIFFVDLDHFKRINDTFGHDVGDEVLVKVATTIRKTLRESDLVCRWGGEEIVIALPGLHNGGAVKVAEKLRAAIFDIVFRQEGLRVTVSIGIAATEQRMMQEEIIKLADEAVYEAKSSGRDRVVMR